MNFSFKDSIQKLCTVHGSRGLSNRAFEVVLGFTDSGSFSTKELTLDDVCFRLSHILLCLRMTGSDSAAEKLERLFDNVLESGKESEILTLFSICSCIPTTQIEMDVLGGKRKALFLNEWLGTSDVYGYQSSMESAHDDSQATSYFSGSSLSGPFALSAFRRLKTLTASLSQNSRAVTLPLSIPPIVESNASFFFTPAELASSCSTSLNAQSRSAKTFSNDLPSSAVKADSRDVVPNETPVWTDAQIEELKSCEPFPMTRLERLHRSSEPTNSDVLAQLASYLFGFGDHISADSALSMLPRGLANTMKKIREDLLIVEATAGRSASADHSSFLQNVFHILKQKCRIFRQFLFNLNEKSSTPFQFALGLSNAPQLFEMTDLASICRLSSTLFVGKSADVFLNFLFEKAPYSNAAYGLLVDSITQICASVDSALYEKWSTTPSDHEELALLDSEFSVSVLKNTTFLQPLVPFLLMVRQCLQLLCTSQLSHLQLQLPERQDFPRFPPLNSSVSSVIAFQSQWSSALSVKIQQLRKALEASYQESLSKDSFSSDVMKRRYDAAKLRAQRENALRLQWRETKKRKQEQRLKQILEDIDDKKRHRLEAEVHSASEERRLAAYWDEREAAVAEVESQMIHSFVESTGVSPKIRIRQVVAPPYKSASAEVGTVPTPHLSITPSANRDNEQLRGFSELFPDHQPEARTDVEFGEDEERETQRIQPPNDTHQAAETESARKALNPSDIWGYCSSPIGIFAAGESQAVSTGDHRQFANEVTDPTVLPVPTAISEILLVPFKSLALAASSLAVPAILNNLGLRKWIYFLQKYAFMERGDLFDVFVEELFDLSSQRGMSDLHDTDSQGLLLSSKDGGLYLSQSSLQYTFLHARKRLDDRLDLPGETEFLLRVNADSPSAVIVKTSDGLSEPAIRLFSGSQVGGTKFLDSICFAVSVPTPLRRFLDPTVLASYNSVFSFLLKLKWVSKCLRDTWIFISTSQSSTGPFLRCMPLIIRTHHEMRFFVEHLQGHLIMQLVHSDHSFVDDPTQHSSLDDLYSSLCRYVRGSMERCMLTDECEAVRNLMYSIFDCIAAFRDVVAQAVMCSELQRIQVMTTELERMRKHFNQYALFCKMVLEKLGSKGFKAVGDNSLNLDELLLRWNMNSKFDTSPSS
eukprot:ANDGO_00323.mRNA.1 Spc97/Spc98 family protein